MDHLPRLIGTPRPGGDLIVVAVPAEAAGLAELAPVLVTGVGRLAAAAALAGHLGRGPRPGRILNAGTAGALRDDPGLAPGTVHRIGQVRLHDYPHAVIADLAGADPHPPLRLDPAPGAVRLATGDAFVADPATRARLARGADLVDMEGYAVAWIAARAGIPARLVKVVSDTAGGGGDAAAAWAAAVPRCAGLLAGHLGAG
ncbi:nucleosidase [Corynebacterium sphenisci]|uniref:nucleosidase n=1 Tax=Corynebacterium sphenisci TaxID=191493 RepID=UPI000952BE0F|nr:nucleosidase [Corynebacterium sphenisci]